MKRTSLALLAWAALGCTSEAPVCYESDDPGRPEGPHVVRSADGECVRVNGNDGGLDGGADAQADAVLPEAAQLSGLALVAPLKFAETFDPTYTDYTTQVPFLAHELYLTASAAEGTSITVDGQDVAHGQAVAVPVPTGESLVEVVASAPDLGDRRYTITVTRAEALSEGSYFKASNSEADDGLGQAVAVDGNWLVVSSVLEDSSSMEIDGNQNDNQAPDRGAVYVFEREGNTWMQRAYLKPSAEESEFGRSVAISGNTVAVGTSDKVYVFVNNDGAWSEQATVQSKNFDLNDLFGLNIDLDGDTLVVGASGEDSAATSIGGDANDNEAPEAGAAYVFRRTDGQWKEEAYLKASNAEMYDGFGWDVAVDGDDIAVSAPYENSSSPGVDARQDLNDAASAGAVFTFHRTDSTWETGDYIKASNPAEGYQFGGCIALRDGLLVVGSVNESSSARGIDGDEFNQESESSGAVYLFRKTGRSWEQEAYLKSSNSDQGDFFGFQVATDGHFVAVTARHERGSSSGLGGDELDNGLADVGAVYLFQPTDNAWKQVNYIKSRIAAESNYFGSSIALGYGTLLVGEIGEDKKAKGVDQPTQGELLNSGAAFTFQ